MDALDIEQLLADVDRIIKKPSDYTLVESTGVFKQCRLALEILSRIAEDNAKVTG